MVVFSLYLLEPEIISVMYLPGFCWLYWFCTYHDSYGCIGYVHIRVVLVVLVLYLPGLCWLYLFCTYQGSVGCIGSVLAMVV